MDYGVIDAPSAEGGAAQKPLLGVPVSGKEVQRQRVGPGIDKVHRLLNIVEGEDRENRTKNLFLHHRVIGRDVVQNGGLNFQSVWVPHSPAENLSGVDQSHDSVEMLLIDHAHIALVVQRICAVHGGNPLFDAEQKAVLDTPVHKQIIRGHAGLAAVEQFAKDQPLCRQTQICSAIHDTRAFAPQLQGDRDKPLCRLGHDLSPHLHSSGKKDVVEWLVQQGLIFLPSSLHHSGIHWGKAVR